MLTLCHFFISIKWVLSVISATFICHGQYTHSTVAPRRIWTFKLLSDSKMSIQVAFIWGGAAQAQFRKKKLTIKVWERRFLNYKTLDVLFKLKIKWFGHFLVVRFTRFCPNQVQQDKFVCPHWAQKRNTISHKSQQTRSIISVLHSMKRLYSRNMIILSITDLLAPPPLFSLSNEDVTSNEKESSLLVILTIIHRWRHGNFEGTEIST